LQNLQQNKPSLQRQKSRGSDHFQPTNSMEGDQTSLKHLVLHKLSALLPHLLYLDKNKDNSDLAFSVNISNKSMKFDSILLKQDTIFYLSMTFSNLMYVKLILDTLTPVNFFLQSILHHLTCVLDGLLYKIQALIQLHSSLNTLYSTYPKL
jgi:hypothetical protein